jgi:plasmid maintenance system antidote protein VapI
MSPAVFFVERFLRPRELSTWQAASQMGLDERSLTGFLEGHIEVDRTLADSLAKFTGTTAMFWLNMQYGRNLSLETRTHSHER